MNIRQGWSGEIQGTWTKMDIEVDENDLILHFIEAGAEDPSALIFTPVEKFKLMYYLGEIFVLLHKMTKFPSVFNNESSGAELGALVTSRNKLTNEILERNGD